MLGTPWVAGTSPATGESAEASTPCPGGTFGRLEPRTEIEPVDFARLAQAAQRVPAERFEAAAVADRGGKLGGDQYPAAEGFAQGLDACGFVDRRSDHREVEPIDGADIAVHHLTQIKREVDFGRRFACLAPRAIQPIDFAHRLGSSVERPTADLLPRRVRERKYREHAVTEEFQ